MTEQFVNLGVTQLTTGITDTDLTFTVDSGSKLPAVGNFRVRIDEELILCTARSGGTVTVDPAGRGIEQSTGGGVPAAHAAGASVLQVLTFEGFQDFLDERDAGIEAPLRSVLAGTKHYEIHVSGANYEAYVGDIDYVVDTDTDIGALLNRLTAPGGVSVHLPLGTFLTSTPITPPDNTVIRGEGPGTVIRATGTWATGTVTAPGSYMFDIYNGSVGRRWVVVDRIWFDCNSLAEGGVRYLGVIGDITQWNLLNMCFISKFRYVGLTIEDFDTQGGTRQHIEFNKIGPGAAGSPTRGIELRCNDVHLRFNDIHGVSDVGLYVAPRRAPLDKSLSTWWWLFGHIAVGNYQAGGVSPDTQPVNIFCVAQMSSGNIVEGYIDNIKRYGIYMQPGAGRKISEVRIERNWFNGRGLADVAGSDKGVALVLDGVNITGSGDIYNVIFADNQASTGYSAAANPTQGRWLALVALRNGIAPGNNYVTVEDNKFKGCMNFYDPAGTRPDNLGENNWIQPESSNKSQGRFSANEGLFTTLQNLLVNPTMLVDLKPVDTIPDGWNRSSSSVVFNYPGDGSLEAQYVNSSASFNQTVPVEAGQVYSISADEKITVDASGLAVARLLLFWIDETGTTISSTAVSSAAGVAGAFAQINQLNKLAPVTDGHFQGTVDTTAGTAAIVAKTGTFPNDTTNPFVITGAGAGGADLITTILTYTDSTHVTLAVAPSLTIADSPWTAWGHGDAITAKMVLRVQGTAPITIRWRDARFCKGTTTDGQSGARTQWLIAHGLYTPPTRVHLTPANGVAAGAQGDTAFGITTDDTNIIVATPSVTAPSWYWEAKV